MWFRIAETTMRRRLKTCIESYKQLNSELTDAELAEATRRASEWLKLNSPDHAKKTPEPTQKSIAISS
jgi:hypothetical protein